MSPAFQPAPRFYVMHGIEVIRRCHSEEEAIRIADELQGTHSFAMPYEVVLSLPIYDAEDGHVGGHHVAAAEAALKAYEQE